VPVTCGGQTESLGERPAALDAAAVGEFFDEVTKHPVCRSTSGRCEALRGSALRVDIYA
jgi:hypothetical protein